MVAKLLYKKVFKIFLKKIRILKIFFKLLICVGMLLVPILVNWMAPNNTIEEWRYVFFVVFFILFFTNLIFCRYCSATPALWAINRITATINNKNLLTITKEIN